MGEKLEGKGDYSSCHSTGKMLGFPGCGLQPSGPLSRQPLPGAPEPLGRALFPYWLCRPDPHGSTFGKVWPPCWAAQSD